MTDPDHSSLREKTLFVSGSSRGIGRAIALRAAADGANVVIAAKTSEPHRILAGTIHTVAAEVERAGGHALPVVMDLRFEDQVAAAVAAGVDRFGGIDIVVNNASAINQTGTAETPMKRFDLMFSVNVRGTFACTQAALPHLKAAKNPHVLNIAPPLLMDSRWFRDHCAYTISKYGMSMCTLGMADEFRDHGIAVNSLWPRTVIATEALRMLTRPIERERCRKPEIMGDAAHAILVRDASECTGNFFIDDEVLAQAGVADLASYAVDPANADRLHPDLFV